MLNRVLAVILIGFLFQACERFPGHYVALNQCLQEHTAIGEELLVAFAELEEYLLSENLLEGTGQADYSTLLTAFAQGGVHLQGSEVAPHVRDFWGLEEAATFGAYMRCADDLSSRLSQSEAASIHQMQQVYRKMRDTGSFEDVILLQDLSQAIEEDDFGFILYRSALLNMFVYMMD